MFNHRLLHQKRKWLGYLAFSILFSMPSLAYGWTGDDVVALQQLAQINATLSRFNLSTANSLLNCGCYVLEQQDEWQPVCRQAKMTDLFETETINFEGHMVTFSQACEEKIQDTLIRTRTLWQKLRIHLALQKQDMQSALMLNEKLTVVNHVENEFAISPNQDIEPLTDDELIILANETEKYISKIQHNFLDLPEIRQFRSEQENISEPQLFRIFQASRLKLVSEQVAHIKAAAADKSQQILNQLPILSYLTKSHVSLGDVVNAMAQVIPNARERLDEDILTQKRLEELDIHQIRNIHNRQQVRTSNRLLSSSLKMIDVPLGILNLPALLANEYGWSESRIAAVIEELCARRKSQIFRETSLEVGVSVAAIAACFTPLPQFRIGTMVVSRLAFTNLCSMGASIAVNSYFLVDAMNRYDQLLKAALSTADGWNQIAELSELEGIELEKSLIKAFFLLEVIPAYALIRAGRVR